MTIKNIDAKNLKKWLENNEAVLIDVREPAEHEAKKINGAKLIPLANISLDSLPEFKNKKLVLHCHSGKRSQMACKKLLDQDSELEIYNLDGGILSWIECNNNVAGSGKSFLPLDRQVQLIIGLSLFIFSLIGYFVNPKFIFLCTFFGAGLTFAALTGWCGLAIILAKMPWNKASKASSCKIS